MVRSKKNMLIFAIVITVFSIIQILLSYFGIVRYFTIHAYGEESYMDNYSKLPACVKDKRVVLSFSLDPSDMDNIKPMLNSLLDQTVKVDAIFATVKQGNEGLVPEWVKKIAVILPTGKDYGECNNIVPILLREKEKDTIIITLQNDVVYGKDFVESMVDDSINHPKSSIRDTKGTALLTKPDLCSGVSDCCSKEYTKKLFMQKVDNLHTLDYTENYKRL